MKKIHLNNLPGVQHTGHSVLAVCKTPGIQFSRCVIHRAFNFTVCKTPGIQFYRCAIHRAFKITPLIQYSFLKTYIYHLQQIFSNFLLVILIQFLKFYSIQFLKVWNSNFFVVNARCITHRAFSFFKLKTRISRRKRNQKKKYFNPTIRGPKG